MKALVPDTPSPMVWNEVDRLIAASLQLGDGVVQEEIDQDGIDLRVWLELGDLPPDELDSVDAAATEFNLPC